MHKRKNLAAGFLLWVFAWALILRPVVVCLHNSHVCQPKTTAASGPSNDDSAAPSSGCALKCQKLKTLAEQAPRSKHFLKPLPGNDFSRPLERALVFSFHPPLVPHSPILTLRI